MIAEQKVIQMVRSDIREKREVTIVWGDVGIEHLEGGNILNMSVEKKWHRWVAVAVALLMLATLVMPTNVSRASADSGLRNPRIAEDGTVTWDCVWFGHYPQSSDGNGGFNNDPIKWRILSVDGNEALLLANKNLDGGIPYNEEDEGVTWETCTMRSWLNGYGSNSNQNGIDYTTNNFINKAFTSSEQDVILQKTVENTDNPEFGTEGGNNTSDKLFLPSIGEMMTADYGFSDYNDSDTREAVNTAYTASRNGMHEEGEADWYQLRSPGNFSDYAVDVDRDGDVRRDGSPVIRANIGVRPALRLNLNSNLWSYAGTVLSDGTVTEDVPIDDNKQPVNFNGHKYQVFTGMNFSWDEAQEYCNTQGGHLVTITTEEENTFLHSIVKSSQWKNMWIGAEKIDEEFQWVTKEKWDYTNWADGEPNNVFEMQNAVMMYTATGTWNDENKEGRNWPGYYLSETGFICEWDNTSSDNHENEKKFIEEHLEFIGQPGSGKYDVMVEHYNFPKAFLRDWSELKDDYEGWKALRLDFFDNPYDIAISNLILNTTDKLVQDESFEINLYSKQRNVTDSVIELIDGKNPLTGEQKGKFEKIFTTKDYSDEESVKLLNQILKNHISTEDLGNLFGVYDKSNAFMGLLENGQITVQAMVNIVDYITVLQMYQDTSDEFKYILTRMMYTATNEEPNPQLADAIESFLKLNNEEDVKQAILDKAGAELLNVGVSIFKSSAETKVGNFIVGNMAGASASMASGVMAAIKIGYDVGTSISNVLVNSDETAKTYMETYAAAKVGENLRYALDEACATLREKKIWNLQRYSAKLSE